jgi:hypothetical protein
MPRSASPRPRLLDARGGVSWVSLLLLVSAISGVYLAWVWVPVFVVDYEVKQVVRDHMYQAVRNRDDASLVKRMLHKLRVVYEVDEVGVDGGVHKVPGVTVNEQDLVWERDTSREPAVLHVAFEYTRDVEYPLLDRVVERSKLVDLTQELSIPDWGPSR